MVPPSNPHLQKAEDLRAALQDQRQKVFSLLRARLTKAKAAKKLTPMWTRFLSNPAGALAAEIALIRVPPLLDSEPISIRLLAPPSSGAEWTNFLLDSLPSSHAEAADSWQKSLEVWPRGIPAGASELPLLLPCCRSSLQSSNCVLAVLLSILCRPVALLSVAAFRTCVAALVLAGRQRLAVHPTRRQEVDALRLDWPDFPPSIDATASAELYTFLAVHYLSAATPAGDHDLLQKHWLDPADTLAARACRALRELCGWCRELVATYLLYYSSRGKPSFLPGCSSGVPDHASLTRLLEPSQRLLPAHLKLLAVALHFDLYIRGDFEVRPLAPFQPYQAGFQTCGLPGSPPAIVIRRVPDSEALGSVESVLRSLPVDFGLESIGSDFVGTRFGNAPLSSESPLDAAMHASPILPSVPIVESDLPRPRPVAVPVSSNVELANPDPTEWYASRSRFWTSFQAKCKRWSESEEVVETKEREKEKV